VDFGGGVVCLGLFRLVARVCDWESLGDLVRYGFWGLSWLCWVDAVEDIMRYRRPSQLEGSTVKIERMR